MKSVLDHFWKLAIVAAILAVPFLWPKPQVNVQPVNVEAKPSDVKVVFQPHSGVPASISPEWCLAAIKHKIKRTEVELEIARVHAEHMRRLLERHRQLAQARAVAREEFDTHYYNCRKAALDVRRLEHLLDELREGEKFTEQFESGK